MPVYKQVEDVLVNLIFCVAIVWDDATYRIEKETPGQLVISYKQNPNPSDKDAAFYYQDFDFEDFDFIGYEITESYKKRDINNLYDTLLGHFIASSLIIKTYFLYLFAIIAVILIFLSFTPAIFPIHFYSINSTISIT